MASSILLAIEDGKLTAQEAAAIINNLVMSLGIVGVPPDAVVFNFDQDQNLIVRVKNDLISKLSFEFGI